MLPPSDNDEDSENPGEETTSSVHAEADELPLNDANVATCLAVDTGHPETEENSVNVRSEVLEMPENKVNAIDDNIIGDADHSVDPLCASADIDDESGRDKEIKPEEKEEISTSLHNENSNVVHSFLLDENHVYDGSELGTEEE